MNKLLLSSLSLEVLLTSCGSDTPIKEALPYEPVVPLPAPINIETDDDDNKTVTFTKEQLALPAKKGMPKVEALNVG